jgi:hypothetical protein
MLFLATMFCTGNMPGHMHMNLFDGSRANLAVLHISGHKDSLAHQWAQKHAQTWSSLPHIHTVFTLASPLARGLAFVADLGCLPLLLALGFALLATMLR